MRIVLKVKDFQIFNKRMKKNKAVEKFPWHDLAILIIYVK